MSNDLSTKLEAFLQTAVDAKVAPGLIAEIFTAKGALADAAAGVRNADTKEPMTVDTVAWMASMSKAVTSMCALILSEKHNVSLDSNEDLIKIIPEFKIGSDSLVNQIFDKKDADGKWTFKSAKVPVTLRHLLTHTAGFGYDFSCEEMKDYAQPNGPSPQLMSGDVNGYTVPRVFEAGEKFLYGMSADWVAEFIIRISGKTLREAQQEYILTPLKVPADTLDSFRNQQMNANRTPVHFKVAPGTFIVPPPEQSVDTRQFEGVPDKGFAILGSAALHGTVASYCIFLRALLNKSNGLISEKLWNDVTSDNLAKMNLSLPSDPFFASSNPMVANSILTTYGTPSDKSAGEGWTAIQTYVSRSDSINGAKKGTLAWSGLANSYFFVDVASGVGACVLAQFVAWGDPEMLKLKAELEKFVFDNVKA